MRQFPQFIFCMVAVLTFLCVNAATERPKLKVLAVNFPPFAVFDKQNGIIDGVDVRLLQTIARKYDFNYFLDWTESLKQMKSSELE